MPDLIIRDKSKSIHATMVGDNDKVVVLIKGFSGNVYTNKIEHTLEKAIKKLVGGGNI